MRDQRLRTVILVAGFITVAGAFTGSKNAEFDVVVNASNHVTDLSRADVAKLFLKKMTRWPNGHPVLGVDRSEDADIRARFSSVILQKDMRQVDAYWQEMIFSGRAVPPPQRRSDAEVIAYVRENSDAIGYVTVAAANAAGDLRIVDVRP